MNRYAFRSFAALAAVTLPGIIVAEPAATPALPDPLAAGWNGEPVCEKLHEDLDHRILRCTFPPGVGHERHYHKPHFGYTLAGGRMRLIDAGGTREVDLTTGNTAVSEGTPGHEVLNVGDSTVVYLVVEPKGMTELEVFARRYADAWSSNDPDAFAAYYAEDGTFRINDGDVSVGREAIAQTAASFMESFPDMVVRFVKVTREGDHVNFHWHWTGTHTGPGGTGNAVDLEGYERWLLDANGLITETHGHMDDAEYQRQLAGEHSRDDP